MSVIESDTNDLPSTPPMKHAWKVVAFAIGATLLSSKADAPVSQLDILSGVVDRTPSLATSQESPCAGYPNGFCLQHTVYKIPLASNTPRVFEI